MISDGIMKITLTGGAPWGFRLSGGGALPLTIVKIRRRSHADEQGLQEGDLVITVNGVQVHQSQTEALHLIENAGDTLTLEVVRGGIEELKLVELGKLTQDLAAESCESDVVNSLNTSDGIVLETELIPQSAVDYPTSDTYNEDEGNFTIIASVEDVNNTNFPAALSPSANFTITASIDEITSTTSEVLNNSQVISADVFVQEAQSLVSMPIVTVQPFRNVSSNSETPDRFSPSPPSTSIRPQENVSSETTQTENLQLPSTVNLEYPQNEEPVDSLKSQTYLSYQPTPPDITDTISPILPDITSVIDSPMVYDVTSVIVSPMVCDVTSVIQSSIEVNILSDVPHDVTSITDSSTESSTSSAVASVKESPELSEEVSVTETPILSNVTSVVQSSTPSDVTLDIQASTPPDVTSVILTTTPSVITSVIQASTLTGVTSVIQSSIPSDVTSAIQSPTISIATSDIQSPIPSDVTSVIQSLTPSVVTSVIQATTPTVITSVIQTSTPPDVTSVIESSVTSDVTSVIQCPTQSVVTPSEETSVIQASTPSEETSVIQTSTQPGETSVIQASTLPDVTSVIESSVPSDVTSVIESSIPSDVTLVIQSPIQSVVTSVIQASTPSDETSVITSPAYDDSSTRLEQQGGSSDAVITRRIITLSTSISPIVQSYKPSFSQVQPNIESQVSSYNAVQPIVNSQSSIHDVVQCNTESHTSTYNVGQPVIKSQTFSHNIFQPVDVTQAHILPLTSDTPKTRIHILQKSATFSPSSDFTGRQQPQLHTTTIASSHSTGSLSSHIEAQLFKPTKFVPGSRKQNLSGCYSPVSPDVDTSININRGPVFQVTKVVSRTGPEVWRPNMCPTGKNKQPQNSRRSEFFPYSSAPIPKPHYFWSEREKRTGVIKDLPQLHEDTYNPWNQVHLDHKGQERLHVFAPPVEFQLDADNHHMSYFPSDDYHNVNEYADLTSPDSFGMRRNLYADSAFYNTPGKNYPTITEQIQLCKKISQSLTSATNRRARGAKMFLTRKRKSNKWIHNGQSEFSSSTSDVANPQELDSETSSDENGNTPFPYLLYSASKHFDVRDFKQTEMALTPEEFETLRLHSKKCEHTVVSPSLCFDIAADLNAHRGRGGRMFQRRKQRTDKFIVDGHKVKFTPPSSRLENLLPLPTRPEKTPWEAALEYGGNVDAAFSQISKWEKKQKLNQILRNTPPSPLLQTAHRSPLKFEESSSVLKGQNFNRIAKGWTGGDEYPVAESLRHVSPARDPGLWKSCESIHQPQSIKKMINAWQNTAEIVHSSNSAQLLNPDLGSERHQHARPPHRYSTFSRSQGREQVHPDEGGWSINQHQESRPNSWHSETYKIQRYHDGMEHNSARVDNRNESETFLNVAYRQPIIPGTDL